MKQIGNLYENIYKFENINSAFNEVCKNTKNKRKVANFRELKCTAISTIYTTLENKQYVPRSIQYFYNL